MQEAGDARLEHALQAARDAAEFVRAAQNSADPQVIQQAQRRLDQATDELKACLDGGGTEGEGAELQQAMDRLTQSQRNLTLSASISDPVWFEPY